MLVFSACIFALALGWTVAYTTHVGMELTKIGRGDPGSIVVVHSWIIAVLWALFWYLTR
jgi:hypothetical protein